MRLEHRWIVLIWSIWTVQFLTTEADDDDCTIELQVRRNTFYKAGLGQELRIECPVLFCNNLPPKICWYKVKEEHICLNYNNSNHIKTEWKILNPSEGIFYLLFQSLTRNDSGEYRCEGGSSVSHSIFIDVYEMDTNDTSKTKTNDTNDQSKTEADKFLMYMYSAAGIGSFVIIVIIISVICMRGCKEKSKTEKQEENQYMAMPFDERPVPNATRMQHSPRGSPNLPPPRRPSGRKTTGQPAEPAPSRDNQPPYSQRTRDRNRNGAQAEEAGSVVYAALNHAPPQREAPRPQREIEETEYAAIRLV